MDFYQKCSKKLRQRDIKLLNDRFIELRERYLWYRIRGDEHLTATELALFDIFEGDDDVDIKFTDKNIIKFTSVIIVFDNAETFNVVRDDYHRLMS